MISFDLHEYLCALAKDAPPTRIVSVRKDGDGSDQPVVIDVAVMADGLEQHQIPYDPADSMIQILAYFVPACSGVHLRVSAELSSPIEAFASALGLVNGANHHPGPAAGRFSLHIENDTLVLTISHTILLDLERMNDADLRSSGVIARTTISHLMFEICSASIELARRLNTQH
jgi:hypothetical protein